jgi:hypothetical protein
MKVAQAKLKEIGPDDMNMEEYKVNPFFVVVVVLIYKAHTLILEAIDAFSKGNDFAFS